MFGLLMYGIAEAKPKQKPMEFPIDPSLSKPLVIYRPYAHEFTKPNPTITSKIQSGTTKTKTGVVEQRKNTPTASKAVGQPSGRDYGQGEIQRLIVEYSAKYGIAPDAPLCIAKKESGFNPNSANKSSSARGVFQYLSSTWKATDEGKAGYSVYDPEANIKAAVKYMGVHRSTKPWVVASKCPPLKFL